MISEQILQIGNSYPYDIDQKTIIFGKTLFQYSGSVRSCKQVLAKFYQRTEKGEVFYPLSEVVRECNLSASDEIETRISTHFFPKPLQMQSCKYRFIEGIISTENQEYLFLTEGSGQGHFLDGLIESKKYKEPRDLHLRILDRITEVTIEPFFRQNASLEKKYGSWFELVYATPQGFKKTPSAIQFWIREKGSNDFRVGPLTFSQYLAHDLLIHTIFPLANGSTHHNMLRARDPLHMHRACDAVHREVSVLDGGNTRAAEVMDFSPQLMTHFLVDQATGQSRFFQLERGDPESSEPVQFGPKRVEGTNGYEFELDYDAITKEMVNSFM